MNLYLIIMSIPSPRSSPETQKYANAVMYCLEMEKNLVKTFVFGVKKNKIQPVVSFDSIAYMIFMDALYQEEVARLEMILSRKNMKTMNTTDAMENLFNTIASVGNQYSLTPKTIEEFQANFQNLKDAFLKETELVSTTMHSTVFQTIVTNALKKKAEEFHTKYSILLKN